MNNETKRCSKCKKRKSLIANFSKNKSIRGGYNYWCKSCVKKYRLENFEEMKALKKKWRENHLEECKAYNKKWKENHLEECRESNRKYREEHPEEMKALKKKWREEHSEEIKEWFREWYKEHSEEAKANGMKWRENHLEESKALQKEWYKRNSERVKAKSGKYQKTEKGRRVRRAITANVRANKNMITDKITTKDIESIEKSNIRKYGKLTCEFCKTPIAETGEAYHADHKTPYSRGGSNLKRNIHISCGKCNRKKNDKTVKEFIKTSKDFVELRKVMGIGA